MRIKSTAFLIFIILIVPVALYALPPVSALHGSWGFTFLTHNETGTWESEGGRFVINADGTGTIDTFFNNNGAVGSSLSKSFTYSATVNGNGTITFTILTPEFSVNHLVINDSQDMMFLDGTRDLTMQKIGVMTRLKDTGYILADFVGEYNALAYEYVLSPLITTYKAHALHFTVDGSGHENGSSYTNDKQSPTVIFNPSFINNYTFSSYGSPFLSFINFPGPDIGTINHNGNVVTMVQRRQNASTNLFGLYFALKREARTYTTADLAGKWIVVGFGDTSGTNFYSIIGALHCNSAGVCSLAQKFQVHGQVFSGVSPTHLFTVSPDGTFGSSYDPPSPPYAAAIGNNGNNLFLTSSLNGNPPPDSRVILLGLRCQDCAIPLETYLPLMLRP